MANNNLLKKIAPVVLSATVAMMVYAVCSFCSRIL